MTANSYIRLLNNFDNLFIKIDYKITLVFYSKIY